MASLFFYLEHFLLSLCRSDSHRHIFLCSFSFCWRWFILTNLLYSVWKLCIWIHVWRHCSDLFSRYQLADCQTHTVLSPRDTWATLQIVRCNLPTDWLALLSSCFSEVWNKLTYRSLVLLQTHEQQTNRREKCFSQIDCTDHEITQEWFDFDCTLTATHNFLFNVFLVREYKGSSEHFLTHSSDNDRALTAACFWKHWIRKTVSIWRLLVMQVCCRLHLSTRGSESVTESGKDGVRLSLFLERQRGSFTSFHSQTKVSMCFPFFLLVPICPASALLCSLAFVF